MDFLQSVAAMLAALLLPLAPVAEVTEKEVTETVEETVHPQQAEEWNLLLVNRWNELDEAYAVELRALSNGLQVDARIYDDLTAMLNDCGKAGLRPIVCSAYRSESTQTRLYNNKIARLKAAGYSEETAEKEAMRWVAIPGTSEHQTGMAVDIVSASYQKLDQKQEETAEQKWLMEHCWEYGFILRYPSDKGELTGIGYEPWHYRYVGKEAAMSMRDSGLCLEEYIRTLNGQKEIPQETNQEAASAAS